MPMIEKTMTKKDEQKKLRDQIAELIIITLGKGKSAVKLQGSPRSRQIMHDAMRAMQTLNVDTTDWILANNQIKKLTLAQLAEAHALSTQAIGALFVKAKKGLLTFDDLRKAREQYEQATR